jgi:hypothetical protein
LQRSGIGSKRRNIRDGSPYFVETGGRGGYLLSLFRIAGEP